MLGTIRSPAMLTTCIHVRNRRTVTTSDVWLEILVTKPISMVLLCLEEYLMKVLHVILILIGNGNDKLKTTICALRIHSNGLGCSPPLALCALWYLSDTPLLLRRVLCCAWVSLVVRFSLRFLRVAWRVCRLPLYSMHRGEREMSTSCPPTDSTVGRDCGARHNQL